MNKSSFKTCFSLLMAILTLFIFINTSNALSKSEMESQEKVSKIINDLIDASNKHEIEAIASLYSNDYLSGDSLNKDQILELIKETWETYPDIKYSTDIKAVRISDNWATVETHDESRAITGKISEITSDKGDLVSNSHTIVYMRRFGKEWKIVGDFTFFERAILKFGTAKELDISFSAPEQVKAGEMYSGKINMEVPVGTFAVGSITKEPIVYPNLKPKEKFRTINQSLGNLERVFESNESNNNELVTATVGITELTEDNQARPTVRLKGICIIGNRVNVIPHSTFDKKEFIMTNKENLDLNGEDDTFKEDE
ncbi:MAG: nuclear transport factor 2 family protein [Cyanobacteriota bacterium]